jgi:hypothetical protein
MPNLRIASIATLAALVLGGCSSAPDEPTGPFADAAKACALLPYGAEVTGDHSLRMQLPRREPDWPGSAREISCVARELGGPDDLGDRVYGGTGAKGSDAWGAYTVEWDRTSRSNGSGDIVFTRPG